MSSTKKSAKKAVKPPKKAAPASKSTERVADSDMESASEDETAAPEKATTTSATSSSGPTEEETSSSGESESGSGSASGSDASESEDESENDSDAADLPAKVTQSKKTPSAILPASSTVSKPSSAPPPPFIPPTGFTPLAAGTTPLASSLLSTTSLASKQLWYITAPASVPISLIRSVSLRDVQAGLPAISVEGQSYGFVRPEHSGTERVLIPQRRGGRYVAAQTRVAQTLHLQHLVRLPELMEGGRATVPVGEKPVRKQPGGLRMRFRPGGFGEGETGVIGEESGEEEGERRVFRKHRPVEVEEEAPRKKHKSHDKERKKHRENKEKRKATA